jgi:hypothetical protein
VDLVAAVVADEQPLVVVEPSERALDDPAGATEAGAVLGLAACDLGPGSRVSSVRSDISAQFETSSWLLPSALAEPLPATVLSLGFSAGPAARAR